MEAVRKGEAEDEVNQGLAKLDDGVVNGLARVASKPSSEKYQNYRESDSCF